MIQITSRVELAEVAEIPLRNDPSVVGILPQPCSGGNR